MASMINPPSIAEVAGKNRDRPSQHGAILGEALADIAKAGCAGVPDFPEMCMGCAFRPGTVANQSAGTVKDALSCLSGPEDFCCHHGMADGEPTCLCAGFAAAKLAPKEVALGTLKTAMARLESLPAIDPVREDFDAWLARVDPDMRLDNYEWARLFARQQVRAHLEESK